jgi:hypothetical protein
VFFVHTVFDSCPLKKISKYRHELSHPFILTCGAGGGGGGGSSCVRACACVYSFLALVSCFKFAKQMVTKLKRRPLWSTLKFQTCSSPPIAGSYVSKTIREIANATMVSKAKKWYAKSLLQYNFRSSLLQ